MEEEEKEPLNSPAKWRMVLGKQAAPEEEVPLPETWEKIDKTLEALYDTNRKGGLGKSSPNINRWLGDIRTYFPTSMVKVLQKDALERLHLKQMLLEPELLEQWPADPELVATLLQLKDLMPEQTRETARQVVRKVVEEVRKKLQIPMVSALRGSLHRAARTYRPKYGEIDWRRTIERNLKHYQPAYQTIIPERLVGYSRKNKTLRKIVLLIDQSGSMASSFVYSCIFGAILASLPAIKTHLVLFDTAVVDMTPHLQDPVEILFGGQLGGGTDISKALNYVLHDIGVDKDTILVLISDLYEGGQRQHMLRNLETMKDQGANCISLLALSDQGAPAYDHEIAAQVSHLGIPVFACTPDLFPGLLSSAINGQDLRVWLGKNGLENKG